MGQRLVFLGALAAPETAVLSADDAHGRRRTEAVSIPSRDVSVNMG
jgi:hypothetical protein